MSVATTGKRRYRMACDYRRAPVHLVLSRRERKRRRRDSPRRAPGAEYIMTEPPLRSPRVRNRQGYEFFFRTSRASLLLGLCGACGTLALGLSAIGLVALDRLAPAAAARAELDLLALLALALVGLSTVVL